MELKEAQRQVDAWISQFEEGYWPPLVNLARLVEEVGELSRELNHRYGSKVKRVDEPARDLALEMADVLFVLLALANEQEIDLGSALEQVLEKYRIRDSDRWVRRPDTGQSAGGTGRDGERDVRPAPGESAGGSASQLA